MHSALKNLLHILQIPAHTIPVPKQKEERNMDKINHCIECSVSSCAHHAQERDYCTLNAIKVGCCCSRPQECDNTECASFAKK